MNRTPSSSLPSNTTPYELWHHVKPNVSRLRTFGCLCSVLIRKEIRHGKFSNMSISGILIGHTEHNFNYIAFIPESNTIVTTHHVTFHEEVFPFRKLRSFDISHLVSVDDHNDELPDLSNALEDRQTHHPPQTTEEDTQTLLHQPDEFHDAPTELPDHDDAPAPALEDPGGPRRSARNNRPPDRYQPSASPAFWDDDHPFIDSSSHGAYAFATTPTVRLLNEPHSYRDAMNSPNRDEWIKACDKEMLNMKDKNVWTLVPRPKDHPIVGRRWHFKIKTNTDGSISKYKARFVAKGFTQTYGVDYVDTFAPTGKPSSYRALVAFAAIHGFKIHQMDAIAAFLNSQLTDTIYMEQPEGYRDDDKPTHVCLLNRALYGLKQSARNWNDDFKAKCVSAGFIQSPADECVYIRTRSPEDICVFYLHVDDLAITGNTIQVFKEEISSYWPMEDLGVAHCVVGIQTTKADRHHYTLGQQAMIHSLLARFGMSECKPASTPFPGGLKLSKSTDAEAADFSRRDLPYRSGVGSLMYLSQCTRPDISYAVGCLSQHLERPCDRHWQAFEHVLQYLQGTSQAVINYRTADSHSLAGNQSWSLPAHFSDSDWAGDRSSRRSTTGYLFLLAHGPISWRSRIQKTVALSSTEAEYRATTEAGQEAIWLQTLLESISIPQSSPIILHCDNLSTIDLAENAIFHGRTKHVEIHHHWIREKIKEGVISLAHCPSKEMVADLLTKPLHPGPFLSLLGLTGMTFP